MQRLAGAISDSADWRGGAPPESNTQSRLISRASVQLPQFRPRARARRSIIADDRQHLQPPSPAVGQAQKHVTVNESLRKLDAIIQLNIVSATTTAQPASPNDGDVWIAPPGKSGAQWDAFADGSLAYYRDGAWVQITPRE